MKGFREGLKDINNEHAISKNIKCLKIKCFQHDLSFKMAWDFFSERRKYKERFFKQIEVGLRVKALK
jgi:hypothetical protein